jgi:hypothetical protein
MELTSKDVPIIPELDQGEREFWLTYWMAGSFAGEKLARFGRMMSLVTQLQVNGIGFDIHISNVVPNVSGGITTSASGHHFFHDMDDLLAILEMVVEDLKRQSDGQAEAV